MRTTSPAIPRTEILSGKLKTSYCITAIGCLVFLFVLAPTARSADKTTWMKYNNEAETNSNTTSTDGRIPLGTNEKGDDNRAAYPAVIKDGATYKMWYSGHDGTNVRIYHATLDALPEGTIFYSY